MLGRPRPPRPGGPGGHAHQAQEKLRERLNRPFNPGYISPQQVQLLGLSPVIPGPRRSGGEQTRALLGASPTGGGSGSTVEAKYSRRLIALH